MWEISTIIRRLSARLVLLNILRQEEEDKWTVNRTHRVIKNKLHINFHIVHIIYLFIIKFWRGKKKNTLLEKVLEQSGSLSMICTGWWGSHYRASIIYIIRLCILISFIISPLCSHIYFWSSQDLRLKEQKLLKSNKDKPIILYNRLNILI